MLKTCHSASAQRRTFPGAIFKQNRCQGEHTPPAGVLAGWGTCQPPSPEGASKQVRLAMEMGRRARPEFDVEDCSRGRSMSAGEKQPQAALCTSWRLAADAIRSGGDQHSIGLACWLHCSAAETWYGPTGPMRPVPEGHDIKLACLIGTPSYTAGIKFICGRPSPRAWETSCSRTRECSREFAPAR